MTSRNLIIIGSGSKWVVAWLQEAITSLNSSSLTIKSWKICLDQFQWIITTIIYRPSWILYCLRIWIINSFDNFKKYFPFWFYVYNSTSKNVIFLLWNMYTSQISQIFCVSVKQALSNNITSILHLLIFCIYPWRYLFEHDDGYKPKTAVTQLLKYLSYWNV